MVLYCTLFLTDKSHMISGRPTFNDTLAFEAQREYTLVKEVWLMFVYVQMLWRKVKWSHPMADDPFFKGEKREREGGRK